ncbi:MAG TPA: M23 family metallopeptidase [Pseudonocardiaceae bacterium]|jgi:murein DD-endopeptidase MepM/ murein hydrolase activator NlpD
MRRFIPTSPPATATPHRLRWSPLRLIPASLAASPPAAATKRRFHRSLLGLLAAALVLTGVLCQAAAAALTGSPSLAPTPTTAEPFQWPLAPPHPVLRRFEPPSTPWGPGHRGVDLGGRLAEPVLAAGSGLVLYAGPLADRSLVSIEHQGGLRTTYEPIRPLVRVGDHVTRGQVIGTLMAGHPGCPATAPVVCLHWGAHRESVYLDPLRLVESGHVRLLPWPADLP